MRLGKEGMFLFGGKCREVASGFRTVAEMTIQIAGWEALP
jgi:hypothetical protein